MFEEVNREMKNGDDLTLLQDRLARATCDIAQRLAYQRFFLTRFMMRLTMAWCVERHVTFSSLPTASHVISREQIFPLFPNGLVDLYNKARAAIQKECIKGNGAQCLENAFMKPLQRQMIANKIHPHFYKSIHESLLELGSNHDGAGAALLGLVSRCTRVLFINGRCLEDEMNDESLQHLVQSFANGELNDCNDANDGRTRKLTASKLLEKALPALLTRCTNDDELKRTMIAAIRDGLNHHIADIHAAPEYQNVDKKTRNGVGNDLLNLLQAIINLTVAVRFPEPFRIVPYFVFF